jgi:cytidylate kinase
MAIVSISRQVGSGGHEIAQLVSKQLGYKLFDRDLMQEIGVNNGITTGEVIDLTAERHHTQTPIERMFGMAPINSFVVGTYEASGLGAEDRSAEIVSRIILAAYKLGNIVVEGRGGQGVLRDRPGVLHVRIVAPLEQRIEQLKNRDNISSDEARKKAKEADSAQAEYIRRYFGADISDPTLYHLIINTGKYTHEEAAELVVKALGMLKAAG